MSILTTFLISQDVFEQQTCNRNELKQQAVGNSFVICYWRLLTLIIGRLIRVCRYWKFYRLRPLITINCPMTSPVMPPQLAHVGPLLMPGTGSIRSVQSVPMLSHGHHTWDGEPCPVHHQHPMVPLAALYGKI